MAKQKSALAALRRFEQAAVSRAFKGANEPEGYGAIEREYKLAKENLKKYLPDDFRVICQEPK